LAPVPQADVAVVGGEQVVVGFRHRRAHVQQVVACHDERIFPGHRAATDHVAARKQPLIGARLRVGGRLVRRMDVRKGVERLVDRGIGKPLREVDVERGRALRARRRAEDAVRVGERRFVRIVAGLRPKIDHSGLAEEARRVAHGKERAAGRAVDFIRRHGHDVDIGVELARRVAHIGAHGRHGIGEEIHGGTDHEIDVEGLERPLRQRHHCISQRGEVCVVDVAVEVEVVIERREAQGAVAVYQAIVDHIRAGIRPEDVAECGRRGVEGIAHAHTGAEVHEQGRGQQEPLFQRLQDEAAAERRGLALHSPIERLQAQRAERLDQSKHGALPCVVTPHRLAAREMLRFRVTGVNGSHNSPAKKPSVPDLHAAPVLAADLEQRVSDLAERAHAHRVHQDGEDVLVFDDRLPQPLEHRRCLGLISLVKGPEAR
jgi:hypothetical protein